jgi:hypothetical protein
MEKNQYDKAMEFAQRMAKDPLLVALTKAEEKLRDAVFSLFDKKKDQNGEFLFKESEEFDLNDGDTAKGLILEDETLMVNVELEDGEGWSMDLRDLPVENLKDIYHILKSH